MLQADVLLVQVLMRRESVWRREGECVFVCLLSTCSRGFGRLGGHSSKTKDESFFSFTSRFHLQGCFLQEPRRSLKRVSFCHVSSRFLPSS